LPQSEPFGPTSNPYRRVIDAMQTRVTAARQELQFQTPGE